MIHLPLLFGICPWRDNFQDDVLVACGFTRQPLSLQAKLLSPLRASGQGHLDRALEGGDLHLGSQSRLPRSHWHLHLEVVPVNPKAWMGLQLHLEIKISCWSATHTRAALARQPDTGSVYNSCWNFDLEILHSWAHLTLSVDLMPLQS